MNLLLSVIIRTLMVANKGPFGQGYGFFQWSCMDARVGLWRKLSTKELVLLNCNVGEDSWESLGLQGDQSWVFFGRNDAKLKLQYFGHLMRRVDSLEKTDAGRDWGKEEKGTTEDEMAGWHHWFDGRESEWTPGVGDGQGGLACCDSWGRKESDTAELLNWTELKEAKDLYIENT